MSRLLRYSGVRDSPGNHERPVGGRDPSGRSRSPADASPLPSKPISESGSSMTVPVPPMKLTSPPAPSPVIIHAAEVC